MMMQPSPAVRTGDRCTCDREFWMQNARKSASTHRMVDTEDNVARFPRYSEARQQGYRAGRRGRSADDNPYDHRSREARAWLRGLSEGRLRRLTVVRPGAMTK
jgi:ribosome modulation factor